MAGILKDRVVELILLSVYVLCPKLAMLSTHYPTFVGLGLEDEDAV